MTDTTSVSFAEKMQCLLLHRAEKQPLPAGYMRCPLNPAHQVPIAAIVMHLEKTHQQDSLASAPNAMYGSHTYARRRVFLEEQLHGPRGAGTHRQSRRRHSSVFLSSDTGSCSSFTASRSRGSSSSSSSSNRQRGRSRRRCRREKRERSPDAQYANGCNSLPSFHNKMTLPLSVIAAAPTETTTIVAPQTDLSGSFLSGRYTLGYSISRSCLMEYLQQFGPLRRCDVLPQCATFTVEYETVTAAIKCFNASHPSVVIDDVKVELCMGIPASFTPFVADTNIVPNGIPSVPYAHAAQLPPTPPPPPPPTPPPPMSKPHLSFLHQKKQQPMCSPSLITVGGMPVSVTMPGSGSRETVAPKNAAKNPPKGVFVAVVRKGDDKEADERRIWEEFTRFGCVKNLMVVGPRVVVEYASEESVKMAAQALQEGGTMLTCCVATPASSNAGAREAVGCARAI